MRSNLFIFLLMYLLSHSLTFSQEKAIKIYNSDTQKEVIIKENRRIRVKTNSGEKIAGKFQIIDNQSIMIKNRQIKLADIEKLKRNPLLFSILSNTFLIYSGSLIVGFTTMIYALTGDAQALWFLLPGSAMIYAGIKSPNIMGSYKVSKNWRYKIITLTE